MMLTGENPGKCFLSQYMGISRCRPYFGVLGFAVRDFTRSMRTRRSRVSDQSYFAFFFFLLQAGVRALWACYMGLGWSLRP